VAVIGGASSSPQGGAGLATLRLHLPASRFAVLAQQATPGAIELP